MKYQVKVKVEFVETLEIDGSYDDAERCANERCDLLEARARFITMNAIDVSSQYVITSVKSE